MSRRRTTVRMSLGPLTQAGPLPALQPYVRCTCGSCYECRDNAKWDRVFAKFEMKDRSEDRSYSRSPLCDL